MEKKLIFTGFIVLLFTSHLIAQKELITQTLESHPYVEINEWYAHEGDLPLKTVMGKNLGLWETEKLNKPFWEKNGIKWFKQDIEIPENLAGLDVVLHVNVAPQATVYINGERLFEAKGYSGKGIVSLSAKAGEKYSIQIKSINGGYNSRFYNARLVGMPTGYGRFLNSLTFSMPEEGMGITDWKYKYIELLT